MVSWKPPDLELKAVIARVPLMPTSQSDSERQTAASASGRMVSSVRSALEAVADRRGRHRLQPEAPDRLVGVRVLDDIAEDQLALAGLV